MKTHRVRTLLFAFTLLLFASPPISRPGEAALQDPAGAPDQQPSKFSTRTSAVLLDVVVRDQSGRPVRDLRASDFEVFKDSVRQDISSFTVFDRAASGARPAGAGESPRRGDSRDALPPGDLRRADAQPSVIAFVFDRMSIEGKRLARKAALTYTEDGYAEGDVGGVFAIDLALRTVQPFTTNLAEVRTGIDRAASQSSSRFASDRGRARERTDFAMWADRAVTGLASGTTGAGAGTVQIQAQLLASEKQFALMEARMLRAFDALERDQQGLATTNGLMALVDGLEPIPGRKTVVFFSEGLAIPANVLAQFRSVISTANRSNVTIYAMDAGGLRAESVTGEVRKELTQAVERRVSGLDDPLRDGPLTRQLEHAEDMLRLNPHSGLGQLADETGGFLIRDTNDASAGFRRIDEDMRFHYVLSYSPTNESYDGRFRPISVRIARPGLQARTRKGYYAVRPDYVLPVRAYEAPALVQLDRDPRPDAFPIGAAALSFGEPDRPGLASVLVEIPGAAITYEPVETDGGYRADFSVVVQIRDERGREIDRLSQHYHVTVPAAKLEATRQGAVLFYREARLAPGAYTAEAVVFDSLATKASVRSASLDIPAASADRLQLSSVFLLKRMETLPPEEQKGRNPLIYGEAMVYPNMGEPLRRSEAGALGFFFTAYPRPKASEAPTTVLELLQNERSLGTLAVDLPKPDARGRIQYAGSLPLEAFAPGAYTLKVTVTDGAASETRTAVFTVVQ